MMKRTLAVIVTALAALTLTVPAFASDEHAGKCTTDWYIAGEGGYFSVCMRVTYADHGNIVTLRQIRVFMPNSRPTEHADGYYFDKMYVKCVRGNGDVDWFFPVSNKVLITDDSQDFNIDPNNMDCGEDNVIYGGFGIINQQPMAPDLNDNFGSSSGNHLPNTA